MNVLAAFALELLLTFLCAFLLVAYLRPYLQRVLADLCGTEDRARFWPAFASVLLIAFPVVPALGYEPLPGKLDESLFGLMHQLSRNLMSFLVALLGLGLIVSFFALVAPRALKEKTS